MKFAEIGYIKEDKNPWLGSFVMKLPKKIRDKYFLVFAPLKIEDITYGGEAGYKITWPIASEHIDYNIQLRFIRRTVGFLMDKEVEVIINQDLIPLPTKFLQARGSLAIAYFLPQLIKNYCNEKGLDLSAAKIAVKDGKNLETLLVLRKLLGEVNHLSICTTNEEAFKEYAEEAYNETGLVAEFFINPKGSAMKEADIIINCSADMENYDYVLKKGAVYIEAAPIKGKLNRLMGRRSDLDFISGLRAVIGEEELDAAQTEAVFVLKCAQMANSIRQFSFGEDKADIIRFLDNLAVRLKV